MKKIAFLFVSAVMIMLFALTAGAASESDLTFELNDDGNSYYVSDCKESAQGELAIPAVYNGNPVTKIGDNAFENCESLTYITIPDGVISIGEYAFLFCSSLTDVAIPDNVTFIGDFAFSYCANLTGVTIPDGVTSIGGWAFYSCDSLTSIIIPDSVTTIGENASYGCKSLTDVYYGGTETQWNDITISDGNEYLTNATIHFSSSSDDANESALSFELNDDGNSYYVSDCDYDAEGNLTVPAIYDGKAVTKIGPYAFEDCISLTGIIIPDSVTSIDYNAFMGCKSLTSITIPDSVTSIGNGAFSGCKTLTGITVDVNNKSFSNDSNGILFNKDKSVLIKCPEGYTGTSYIIPDSVTTIGSSAFERCESLKSVTVPDGITSIADYAFCDCTGLLSIAIPDGVTAISKRAFAGCTSLTSITIPGSVKSIDDYAFEYCISLANVTIPDSVTSIGDNVFALCESLTSITIPDGVTGLGCAVFDFCTKLTSITIPDSVTKIGYGALYNCKSLTDVYYGGTEAQWNEITIDEDNECLTGATIHFKGSSGTVSESKLTFGLNSDGNTYYVSGCDSSAQGELVIPATYNGKSVTSIGDYAFLDCADLTSITIPGSVASIGGGAFSNCTGLTGITIPDGVTSIGDYAFSDCTNLKSITISDSVKKIAAEPFYNTGYYNNPDNWENNVLYIGNHLIAAEKSITSCDIRQGTKTIANGAFNSCTALTGVTIPDSVTSIGTLVFSYCRSLTSITVDTDNGYYSSDINGVLFDKGKSVLIKYPEGNARNSYIIPDGVTSIADQAFRRCKNLTSITIPDSVRSMGDYAFSDCASLTSITIPDGVTSLDYAVLDSCTELASITIPGSVTKIGSGALYRCEKLTDVYYGGTEAQWNNIKIDYGNDSLTKATIQFNGCTHTEVIDPAAAPTCTVAGKTEGKHCSVCNEVIVAQQTVAAKGHKLVTLSAVAATCTKTGLTAGKKCSVCGTVTVAQKTVAKKAHTHKTTVTAATLKKNGKTETKCTVCGYVSKTTTIYYPKTIKLSKTSYTYNGKTQTPSVTVKDSKGNALKKDTDYTVKYASGRKNTGKYSVTITFKGKYSGTKTLYFNILPSKTSKITPTCSTTEIKASWKSVTGASGYKVELLNSKGKVVKSVTTTKTSYTFKKLSKVTTYKIRVTAYKTIDKKAVYSTVSTTITTSTAPAKVSFSKVTAGSKSATPAWKTVSGASGYEVQYSTSSKFKSAKTATVKKGSSKKTTIKKLTKGKKYYFKVRAYKIVDGKKVYGAWSSVKNVKVK